MSWTPIAKPNSTPYTNVNPTGKEQYDQSSITYDDPTVFYDGVNMSMWTDVAKPTDSFSVTITPGMATGLLMPLTYSTTYNISGDSWIRVPKPTT